MSGPSPERPERPPTLNGNLRQLPPALAPLKAERRWVVWRWEHHQGRAKPWTKVPYQPDRVGTKARTNDPLTWGSYQSAVEHYDCGSDGIGFMLLDSTFGAFDLDDCRDPETGTIAPWARTLVERAASYAEVTVSGTGLRIIGVAAGPYVHRKQPWPGSSGSIETYRRAARYIVVTGQELVAGSELANIDVVIDEVVASLDARAESRADAGGSDFDFLPDELVRLIWFGVPEGSRSDQFHRVVRWLAELGFDENQIEDLLRQHPAGIASKFINRLRPEIERCYRKPGTRDDGFQHAKASRPMPITATPYAWTDPCHVPTRDFLYGRHLIRGYVSGTVAPGGAGKTALKVIEALSMVSGRDLLNQGFAGPPLRVWLWNLEDPRDELTRRIQAAAKHYDITASDLGDRLFVDTGREQACVVAEVTTESSRGGKALTDACRSVITINRMSRDEGERASVENHRLFFRTFNDKNNLAPPPETSQWFRMVSVDLGNGAFGAGDSVGVVTSWTWPNPLDDVSVHDLRAIQLRVANGSWRENSQAKNWVGIPIADVLKLSVENKAHRARIAALLKIWIGTGMFVIVAGKDKKGNDRPFVEVGRWASD